MKSEINNVQILFCLIFVNLISANWVAIVCLLPCILWKLKNYNSYIKKNWGCSDWWIDIFKLKVNNGKVMYKLSNSSKYWIQTLDWK